LIFTVIAGVVARDFSVVAKVSGYHFMSAFLGCFAVFGQEEKRVGSTVAVGVCAVVVVFGVVAASGGFGAHFLLLGSSEHVGATIAVFA
jgi:hypothetical protein